ncbi:titin isoform X2 [Penaeus vannamei]|uniref:titin isoform X2 n=1 Tax=Penaeus vannamei TaxID=6689 RepID=UPI00387FAF39
MLVSVFSVVTLAAATVVAAPQKGYSSQQESAPSLVEPLRAVEATLQEQVVLPESSNLVHDDEHHHHDHHDHVGLDWLRDSVPGEPGVDYPIFGQVPKTSFRCRGRQPGYYADTETRCQVFHICNARGGQGFLCPNGTIFDQQHFTCKWWFTVNCEDSEGFFDLNNNIGSAAETQGTQVIGEGFGQKTEQPQGTQQVQQTEQFQPEIQQVQGGQAVQETQEEERPILLPDQIPTRDEGVLQVIQPVPQESGTVSVQQPQEVLISQVPQEENTIHNVQEISSGTITAEIEDSTIRQVINQLLPDHKDTQNTPSTSQEAQNKLDAALEKPAACGQGSADCVARPSEGVSQLYDVSTTNTGESVSEHNLPQEPHATEGRAEEENQGLIVPGISQLSYDNKAIVQDHQVRDSEVKNEIASPELSAAPRYDDTPETIVHISQIVTSIQEEKMPPTQENQLHQNDEQLIAQGLFPVQTDEQQAAIQGEQVFDEQGTGQILTQEPVSSLQEDSDLEKIQFPAQEEEQFTTQTAITEEESPIQLGEQGGDQLSIQEEEQHLSQEGEYHAKVQEYVPLQDEYLASAVEARTGNEQIYPLQWRIRVPMPSEEGSPVQGEGQFAVNQEEGNTIQVEEEPTTPAVPLQDEEQFVENFEEQFPTLASDVQSYTGEQNPVYNEEYIPAYGHEQIFTPTGEQFPTEREEHFSVHTIEVLPVDDGNGHFSVTTVFPEQLDDESTGFPVPGEGFPVQEEEVHGYGIETSDVLNIPPTKVPSTFIIEIPSEVFEAPAEVAAQGTFGVAQTDLPPGYMGEQETSSQPEVAQKEYTEDYFNQAVTSFYGLQEKDETTVSPTDLEHDQVPEAVQPLCNSISCPSQDQEYSYGIVDEVSPQTPPFTQDLSVEKFDSTQVQDSTGLVEEEDYSNESSEEIYGGSDNQTTVAPEDSEQNEVFQVDIRHESPVTFSGEGDFQEPEVSIIHQIPQLYEAPETAFVTEEAVTAFETGTEIVTEVPEQDNVQLKLHEGSLEIDSSLYIIPDVHPEVLSSSSDPVDPVVSLIQRGENDRRQNASSNTTHGVSTSDQGPAEDATQPTFLQDEYTTILPDTREDVTPTPYDEDTTSIPTEGEDTTFLLVAKEDTTPFPADVEETTAFQTGLHDITDIPFNQVDEARIPLSTQGDHDTEGLIAPDVHANTGEFNKDQDTGYPHTNYHQESQAPEITYYEASQDQASDSVPQTPQEAVTFEQETVAYGQTPQEPVFEEGLQENQEPVTLGEGSVTFEQTPHEPVTFEQRPQDVTFEQVPQELATFDEVTSEQLPQRPVTFEHESQNTVTYDQVPQEPVTFDQVLQEPVTYDKEPQEPVILDQVPQEPVIYNQVPQEPVTLDQVPQEPVTFDQEPQEPVTLDQVPQEPVTFDQVPQEPVTYDKEPQEPVIVDQVPQEPVIYNQVPQEPVTLDQVPQEPVTFDQEPQEPVTLDQVPQEPVTFDQVPQEPVTYDKEPQEPVILDQVPQEPVIYNQVPQEPITLDQVPQEPVTFDQVPQEPVTYNQVPQEPVTFDQEPQEPVILDQVPQEPVTYNQVPQEPVILDQVPQEPVIYNQVPQEPVTLDQVPQEPVTFDQVPQEPITLDQVPQEPVTFDQVPQEPVTLDQVPQEPVTFDQVPQEPITLDQVPQEPVTFDQVPQEPVTLDQEPQEPVTFDQVPQEPVTYNQVPQEPVTYDQEPQEPVTLDQVPQEPITFDQGPQGTVIFEPVTFEQGPQEPVILEQGPQETIPFEQNPLAPTSFEQETVVSEQEPAIFEQGTVTFEQAPREPVTFEERPEVPFTLDQATQSPFSPDQPAQEPFSFEQTFPESHTFQQTSQDFPRAPPLLGLYLPPHA